MRLLRGVHRRLLDVGSREQRWGGAQKTNRWNLPDAKMGHTKWIPGHYSGSLCQLSTWQVQKQWDMSASEVVTETLIVSDVHLGSDLSLAADLLDLLQNSTFKRLILLGDIFADLNFSRLTKEHWRLISYLRKLSNPKRSIEVVWIEGNHDAGITQVMEH